MYYTVYFKFVFDVFSAWTKADLIHLYEENKEKYAQGSKRSVFLNAVKSIENAVERFKQGAGTKCLF